MNGNNKIYFAWIIGYLLFIIVVCIGYYYLTIFESQSGYIASLPGIDRLLAEIRQTCEGYSAGSELCIVENKVLGYSIRTLAHTSLGLFLSIALAIFFFIPILVLPLSKYFLMPFAITLKATPVVVFIPIYSYFIEGDNSSSMIITVVSGTIAFFPILVGLLSEIKNKPRQYSVLEACYGASFTRRFMYIDYRFYVRGMLVGSLTAAPLAFVGAVVGEMVVPATPPSIGFYFRSNIQSGLENSSVVVTILVSSVLGLVLFSIARSLLFLFDKIHCLEKNVD